MAIEFRLVRSPADWEGAASVRRTVFVQEQGVPEELEMDALDAAALHLAAVDAGRVIGTARMYPEADHPDEWHVGRVAVLPDWRNRQVGTGLMALAAEIGREKGARKLRLNAQLPVIPFYERLGYVAEGDTFLEAGITHRAMYRTIAED